MHFARSIPGWNSLDSVRRTHSVLEAAALVFFVLLVLFDIWAHLSKDDKKKTFLEKIALCFFAIAVSAEIVAYPYGQRNDTLSGQTIGSLDSEAREALTKSGTALTQSKEAETKSSDAIGKAGKAQESLGKAEDEANRAQTASSNALGIANDAKQASREARKEADSFEKDIASTKTQAATAESHLADALKQVAEATRELNELKAVSAPRRLSSPQKEVLVAKVSTFTTKTIRVDCWEEYGTEIKDLANDFFEALSNPKSGLAVKSPICAIVGDNDGLPVPPITLIFAEDRQHDEEILFNSLVDMGINKNHIRKYPTSGRTGGLSILVGPRPHGN